MNNTISNINITLSAFDDIENGYIEVSREDKTALRMNGMGKFVQKDGSGIFKISSIEKKENSLSIVSSTNQIKLRTRIFPEAGESRFIKFEFEMENMGKYEEKGRIFFEFNVCDTGIPRWMIPSIFYKENRPQNCKNKWYPRYDYLNGKDDQEPDQFVSDYWAFRSDRSSFPSIFCWTDSFTTALITDETFTHGTSGLYFKGNESSTSIGLNFPFCEEPIANIKYREGFKPEYREMVIRPGEIAAFSFRVYIGDIDLHNYNGPMREIYWKQLKSNCLNPWVTLEEAAELTAYGLHKWHYKDEYKMLYETIGFDNVISCLADGRDCRPHMHIAWVSGVPYAFALLKYGVKTNNGEYVRAGINVIDKVAEGMAPGGMLWSQWTVEKGWDSGWNPKPNWSQARTVSEAILFLIRAYKFEVGQGRIHENWKDVIEKNINYALKIQREDGNFGSYYDALTGTVEEWDGSGGILWIAALSEAHKAFGNNEYRDCAVRGGSYYKKFILDEYIYGAPEDVHLAPTSEDTYNGVLAFVLLFDIDSNSEWLELARKSADLMMTFRWTYNVEFSGTTLLGQYDFKTRGGDSASPSNNHIHNYGLICLPEMLRLCRYTGDEYYLRRTADNIACFLQFIAREDGDFSAMKGMVTEQWYYTDWWRPKGSMLALSHAWCIGLTLYASMEIQETGILPAEMIFERGG